MEIGSRDVAHDASPAARAFTCPPDISSDPRHNNTANPIPGSKRFDRMQISSFFQNDSRSRNNIDEYCRSGRGRHSLSYILSCWQRWDSLGVANEIEMLAQISPGMQAIGVFHPAVTDVGAVIHVGNEHIFNSGINLRLSLPHGRSRADHDQDDS